MAAVVSIEAGLQGGALWRGPAKRSPAQPPRTTHWPMLDAVLPDHGWPLSGLIEVLPTWDGLGELQLILPTLAALTQQHRAVVLVAPPYRPCIAHWQQHGLDLTHVFTVHAEGNDALWAMEQALRSGHCGAVIGWLNKSDDKSLRRLNVAAQDGNALCMAYRPSSAEHNPSPAVCRLRVTRRDQQSAVRVIKCRGGFAPPTPIALPLLA
jgi:cell division inhibitor SulA